VTSVVDTGGTCDVRVNMPSVVLKSSTTCEVAAAARAVAAQSSARMMRGHICVLNLAPIASSVLATAGVLAGVLGVTTYNLLPVVFSSGVPPAWLRL